MRGRFLPLLIALAVLFPLYPVMVELGRARLYRLILLLVLVLAAYVVSSRKRRTLLVVLALGVPAAVSQAIAYADPGRTTFLVATLLGLLFLGYVTVRVLVSVLEPGRVDRDKLAGAMSVYLLLGLVWALVHALVALLVPGAFSLPDEEAFRAGIGEGTEYAFIYYSFVTMTTLGYGDIVPTQPISQSLAWMEALMGQLYLAILIARLVGLHIVHSEAGKKPE